MDRLLDARINGQAGLVTRAQAVEAGLTDEAIRWRLSTGRWVRMHPGVYLTRPGRSDWEVRAVAALLHLGSGAALYGRSAGHAWGLLESPGDPIEAVVPETRRGGRRGVGIEVRRSRHIGARVHPTAWPHRTTVEHTVFDLAEGHDLDRAVRHAARACQLRMTTPALLLDALATRPTQSHRALLTLTLGDVDELESVAEVRYVRDVEAAHGLPTGQRQREGGGTRRDSSYDGVQVIVEIDGRLGHEGWAGRVSDSARDRRSATRGWLTVRAGWVEVAGAPCELA
ncbi:MAG TPA: type IV toxin-antitoxin system AbiEi family antitoxin domain-containing protein, partial [Humibacillus xanthopallidus]|nr:type IV toxin-antitoxin system AbiEi family antitoxin domain-containing protein [Humibacillus xanthopallidus]